MVLLSKVPALPWLPNRPNVFNRCLQTLISQCVRSSCPKEAAFVLISHRYSFISNNVLKFNIKVKVSCNCLGSG